MKKMLPMVPHKSALVTALSYMRDYRGKLIRYTERGDLPIDENSCENVIRPFAVGRKAWLFSDTSAEPLPARLSTRWLKSPRPMM